MDLKIRRAFEAAGVEFSTRTVAGKVCAFETRQSKSGDELAGDCLRNEANFDFRPTLSGKCWRLA